MKKIHLKISLSHRKKSILNLLKWLIFVTKNDKKKRKERKTWSESIISIISRFLKQFLFMKDIQGIREIIKKWIKQFNIKSFLVNY